jgi:hypothetical protein
MSTFDRRAGNDRRTAPRFAVSVPVIWEGKSGRKKGTVNDISREGCFVLCSGDVDDGEIIKLFMPLSDGMKVQILGEVVNHIFELGFGVRFVELSVAQRNFISKLLDAAKK